jgi:hypothetical protein
MTNIGIFSHSVGSKAGLASGRLVAQADCTCGDSPSGSSEPGAHSPGVDDGHGVVCSAARQLSAALGAPPDSGLAPTSGRSNASPGSVVRSLWPFLALIALLTGCASSRSTSAVVRGRGASSTPVIGDSARNAQWQPVWEAALRYYRARRGETEADRARRAHVSMGIESGASDSGKAPIVLFATRQHPLSPYDTTWLEYVRALNLVAGVCSAPRIDLCADTLLTTYLSLDDPFLGAEDTATVWVWETALNPVVCRTRDAIVDTQVVTLRLVRIAGEWRAEGLLEGYWHLTSSCSRLATGR